MERLRNYDVAFAGLKEGKHQFQFEVGEAFFQLFEAEQEFTNPRITVDVELLKRTTFLEFHLHARGTIQLICDVYVEPYDHPIDENLKMIVKFGEDYDELSEEVAVIPFTDYAYNIAQLIYEMVVLAVPMKKLCPAAAAEAAEEEEKTAAQEPEADDSEEMDPRWAALKKLKDKN